MNFEQAISTFFLRYSAFSGPATRPESWRLFLFRILASVAVSMSSDSVAALVSLTLMLSWLAVDTRGLHDIGKSGG